MTDTTQQSAAPTQPQSFIDFLSDKLKGINTNALRNTACIATFSSSRFGDDVKDDELSAELGKAHGSDSDNFEVKKKLFAKECPELNMLTQAVRAAYTKHRKLTKPWKKRGGGLLPNVKIPDYLTAMGEASQKVAALREMVRQALPAAHARAKAKLGTAYKESDYKDLMSIPDRFELHFELEPIPEADDLVMPEGFEDVQLSGLKSGIRDRFARAIEFQWRGIERALIEGHAKASKPDVKRWHESLLTNITGPTKELLSFTGEIFGGNDAGTSAMTSTLKQVESTFSQHTVKRIAAMPDERKRFLKDCLDTLKAMSKVSGAAGWQVQETPEVDEEPQAESLDPQFPQPAANWGTITGGVVEGIPVVVNEAGNLELAPEQDGGTEALRKMFGNSVAAPDHLMNKPIMVPMTPEQQAISQAAQSQCAPEPEPEQVLDAQAIVDEMAARESAAIPLQDKEEENVAEQSVDDLIKRLLGV